MFKNLFVVGLDDFHLAQLQLLKRAGTYCFHSLISYEEIKCRNRFPVQEFLEQVPHLLHRFTGKVDAIIGFWDFPVSTMLPIIRNQAGLDGPTLSSVLKCEHKFWSRIEQSRVVPDLIPNFQSLNPFLPEPERQLQLNFPFWLKPVKSVLSHLGFLIRNRMEFKSSIKTIREHIGRYAEPFNLILGYADLPPEIKEIDGYHCIVEELISQGQQCTLEGYVHAGEVTIYGIVDSIREGPYRSCFSRYQYPSKLPHTVKQRMIKATVAVLTHLGYDKAPFNIEFYWNSKTDEIKLLEINTRISKSHCPLFKLVDGEYHHDIMIDTALARKPDFPCRQGKYREAAKFMLRRHMDGRVRGVPTMLDLERVKTHFPDSEVIVHVKPGTRLSELRDQDSYSYEIADIFLGADSHQQLQDNYRIALSMLPFTIDDIEEAV